MKTNRVLIGLGFSAALAAGCAPWSKPLPPGSNTAISPWVAPDAGATGAKPGPNDPPPTTVEKISAGFSDARNNVRKLFHRASKKDTVEPADSNDPVSLNSKPAHPSPEFYVSVARVQEQAGNVQGAIDQCRHALAIDPTNLTALLALARLYDRQGELQDATTWYRETTRRHPREPAAFNDLGLCYARQQRYDESIDSLKKAVSLQPDKALYRNNLATVLVETGRTDEALAALAPVHGKAIAHYNIGFLLNKRGKKDAALAQFRMAAAEDRNFDAARQWVDSLGAEIAGQGPAGTSATVVSSPRAAEGVSAEPPPAVPPQREKPEGSRLPPVPPVETGPMLQMSPSTNESPAISDERTRYNETRRPVRSPSSQAAVPPTPDQVREYRDRSGGQLQPLPPVEPAPYPPSRY